MHKLTANIITYNLPLSVLQHAVTTLCDTTPPEYVTVKIVNNGPPLPQRIFPSRVVVIENGPDTKHLTRTWNDVIEWSDDQWVMISNDDVEFKEGWFQVWNSLVDEGNQLIGHGFSIFTVNKQCWLDVGKFDENFRYGYCEDADFMIRCIGRNIKMSQEFGPFNFNNRLQPYFIHLHRDRPADYKKLQRGYLKHEFDTNHAYFANKYGGNYDHMPSIMLEALKIYTHPWRQTGIIIKLPVRTPLPHQVPEAPDERSSEQVLATRSSPSTTGKDITLSDGPAGQIASSEMMDFWQLELRDGNRIYIPASLAPRVNSSLLAFENYPEDAAHCTVLLLQAGMNCLDVGARFGLYATAMAKAVEPAGRVFAFEPDPHAAKCLARNQGDNLHIITKAVGDISGKAGLTDDLSEEKCTIYGLDIEQISLDEWWIKQRSPPIDLLRIAGNVNNFAVCRGAKALIRQCRPIILFSSPQSALFREYLMSLDYTVYLYLPLLNRAQPIHDILPENRQAKLLAVHSSRHQAVASLLAGPEQTTEKIDVLAYLSTLPWPKLFLTQRGTANDFLPNGEYLQLLQDIFSNNPFAADSWLKQMSAPPAPPIPVRVTGVRGLLAMGRTTQAIELLRTIVGAGCRLMESDYRIPFLPPYPAMDNLPIHTTPDQWLEARCLESLLLLEQAYHGPLSPTLTKPLAKLLKTGEMQLPFIRLAALRALAQKKAVNSTVRSEIDQQQVLNRQLWLRLLDLPSCDSEFPEIPEPTAASTSPKVASSSVTLLDTSSPTSWKPEEKLVQLPPLLYAVHAPLDYMRPPIYSKTQTFCGPGCTDKIDGDGKMVSLKTPVGRYDIAEVVAKLPSSQQPGVFIAHIDATMRNLPYNIEGLEATTLMILGDTHHLQKPLQNVSNYVAHSDFDYYVADCKKHHLHFFYELLPDKKFLFFPGIRTRFEATSFMAEKKQLVSFVGQSSQFHPYRVSLLNELQRHNLPFEMQSASQEEASKIYASSLISLNISLNSELNMRFFEVIAAGGFLLTDRLTPFTGYDLLFKEGRDFVFFEDKNDLVEKVKHYLRNPEEALQIAANGFATYKKYCTITSRRKMFADLILDKEIHPILKQVQDERFRHGEVTPYDLLDERVHAYEFIQDLHKHSRLEVYISQAVPDWFGKDLADLIRIDRITDGHGQAAVNSKQAPRVCLLGGIELLQSGIPDWVQAGKFDYVIPTSTKDSPPRDWRPDCERFLLANGYDSASSNYPMIFKAVNTGRGNIPLRKPLDTFKTASTFGELSASGTASLQNKYGLSYQIPYLQQAEKTIGLFEKKVLLVGDNLPEQLLISDIKVSNCTAIENFFCRQADTENGNALGTRGIMRGSVSGLIGEMPTYQVLDDDVEDLPSSLHGAFDRVISIGSFERIHKLGAALATIHNALKPGGYFFAMISPVWSAHNGHNISSIVDKSGRAFSSCHSPIPPWGHLLLSPPQMEHYLGDKTDDDTAAKLIYHIYHDPHINRLFIEDYQLYCQQSTFEIVSFTPVFTTPVPDNIANRLRQRHPSYSSFANSGIRIVLKKR